MNDLQDATELICDLKGSVLALNALVVALLDRLPPDQRHALAGRFDHSTEVARTVLLNEPISEHTIAAFERDARRISVLIEAA